MRSEWKLLWRLGRALGLSTTVGFERELRGARAAPAHGLVSELGELEGVLAVHVADANAGPD